MSISVTTTTGKNAPIGITSDIIIFPSSLIGIMQSYRNVLVGGFCIKHRLYGFVCPCRIYIHPIILFCVIRNRIVSIAHTLSVTSVPTLEHVKIEPCSLAPPSCRSVSSTWMIGHQVVLIDCFNRCGESLPYLWSDISLYISTHDPDNVWLVFITVGKKCTIPFSIFHR